MRFRTKTILGVALIELALLAVLVGSALSILRDSNEAELVRRVQLGGKLLAAAAKDAIIAQDLATLDSLVTEAMATGQIDFVRIRDSAGVVLTQRGEARLRERPFRQDARIDQISDGMFDWVTPVSAGGMQHGEVQISVSTDALHVLLASAQRWAAGIAGLEIVLVALFSWLLGSYLVRQLDTLRIAIDRFGAGDLRHRVQVQGRDELAQTAAAFNRMAEQLGESQNLLLNENLRRVEAQQAAESAQRRAEERTEQLNAIFALSQDGLVSFDATRRVRYANPAFLRMTGLRREEITGLDEGAFSERLAQVCAGHARFPGFPALRAAHQAASGRRTQNLIELAGAIRRVLDVRMQVSASATVAQILYLHDVTHETEVDRMKSEFLSTAAHELRTPMTSIYGFSELLLMRRFDEATQRELVETIHRNARSMTAIVNELLDLARIEEKRGKDFAMVRIELHELLAEIVTGFKPADGRPSPAPPPGAAPLWVRADREKLTQAVNNVISNAYKYSPADSQVRIELAASAGTDDAAARAGICVIDQGIGMTPQQLARVFERFYRADTSGRVPGTGLGMSIVKEIVELLGGSVEIDSALGTGTRVTLWLPADAEASAARPGSPASPT